MTSIEEYLGAKDGSVRSGPLAFRSSLAAKIASGYAHDSRHRLGVIQLSLNEQYDQIRNQPPSQLMADLSAHNRAAFSEARMLSDMLEDVFLYLRLGGGVPIPIEKKALYVGPLLNRISEQYKNLAKERGIELRVRQSRMAIYTDQRLFCRVLCNLLDNSLNHSKATKLIVGMRIRGEHVVLEVADNGRGIPDIDQSRIFEEGFRGSQSGGCGPHDRGLGLFIVKSLVEMLDGSIELKSAPGKGARFRVSLTSFIDWQPRGMSAPHAERNILAGKTVAVLEDHVETLRLYESAFASRGARVIAADNLTDWVTRVVNANAVPDLVLVDWVISRGTSDVAIRLLRSALADEIAKRGKKVGEGAIGLPIVIVTGNPAHPELKRVAKKIPVLQKPLTQQSIEALTQVAAGKRALNAAEFVN